MPTPEKISYGPIECQSNLIQIPVKDIINFIETLLHRVIDDCNA